MNRILKKSSKLLLIAFVTLMSTNIINAQRGHDGPPPPPPVPDADRVEKMVEHMAIELSLTDDQKVEIKKLYKEHFDEVRKKMEVEQKVRDKERAEKEKIREEFEKEVKALLSDEQIKQFDEFQKNRHRGKGHERGERGREKGECPPNGRY